MRDQIIDFISYWSKRAEIPTNKLVRWIGISASKYFNWRERYGQINEHNALVPRDHWLEDWEKQRITKYALDHPLSRLSPFELYDA